jgi:hypothetical protein
MTEHPQTSDNILIRVYDADSAPTADIAGSPNIAVKQQYRTHNTTRTSYHETVIGALNGVTPDLTVDALALGDSTAATATLPKGKPLGNEVFRTPVTDTFVSEQTFSSSTFLDSTEANTSLEEAALIAEQPNGDIPVNRFKITDPGGLLSPKSNDETVTIDITITQEDA